MNSTPADDLQEKIDFFLISAHELRTSLTAMKWILTMLLEGDFGVLTETQSAMITQASSANERMIMLVNDTMTAIRADDASTPYAATPVSLSTLTEESINDFTSEAARRGMHIRYTPSATPVVVIGDKERLRIVLHNLLENAIKYGNENTDIIISLTISDQKAVLTVTDHGIIIPPDEQSHVFEKFFRASTTKKNMGVGLGLYATKHIVVRHHGTLTFTSDATHGTAFTLTLPIG
ncbi:MAG TPA: HAMP domain-containing sensor histidine kinase [Candidatus Paceibacterota bacterium]|nr:HAMP domain-containing sensor histidine kinase [Candidatus Paceibacterota bacterium]